ncbi:MAG: SRPBCC family protein [Myxococcota bacterium]
MLFLIALSARADVSQPSLDRPTHAFEVVAVLPDPIDRVWEIMAVDYGRIAESHPQIVRSDYVHGALEGGLGVERSCWFSDSGSRQLHEQIVSWRPDDHTFGNRILDAKGFPIDPDNTLATYRLEAVDPDHTRVRLQMEYRTAPAMMGGLMKGAFRKLFEQYLVAVHGHLATGQPVNRDTYRAVAEAHGDEVVFER